MIPVGQHIYIHSGAPGANNLIISAHGNGRGCGMFQVPDGVTLNFYGSHGNRLTEADIDAALNGAYKIVDRVGEGGQSHNYYLNKYQGGHGGWDEAYWELAMQLRKARTLRFDILTIRNRWSARGRTPLLLSEVLAELRRCGRSYPMVYCLFCRSLPGAVDEYPMPLM